MCSARLGCGPVNGARDCVCEAVHVIGGVRVCRGRDVAGAKCGKRLMDGVCCGWCLARQGRCAGAEKGQKVGLNGWRDAVWVINWAGMCPGQDVAMAKSEIVLVDGVL